MIDLVEAERLARVITRASASMLTDGEEGALLREVADLCDEKRAITFTVDPFSLSVELREWTGFRREDAEQLIRRQAAAGLWFKTVLRMNVPGETIAATNVGNADSHSVDPKREQLVDFFAERGIHGCAGGITRRTVDHLVCLCVYSDRADGFTMNGAAVLRILVREFAVAANLRNQINSAEAEYRLMAAILDLCQTPVLVTNANGVVVRSNAAAQAMLAEGGPLTAPAGRLTAVAAADSNRLAAQIARAAETIGSTLFWNTVNAEGDRVLATISNLQVRVDGSNRGFVLVSINDQRRANELLDSGVLMEMFGLTGAEDRVARLILGGAAPNDVARQTKLSLATIRTHLSRVFEKTETNSQSGLIRLLCQLGPFRHASRAPAGRPIRAPSAQIYSLRERMETGERAGSS